MTKMVPVAQAGDDNISYNMPVACDENTKVTFATATKKCDSFDEKTKNSSAPSPENDANNSVNSR